MVFLQSLLWGAQPRESSRSSFLPSLEILNQFSIPSKWTGWLRGAAVPCRGSRQVGCCGTAVSMSRASPGLSTGVSRSSPPGTRLTRVREGTALSRGRCEGQLRSALAPSAALPALNMAAAPTSKMAAAAPRPRRKAARRALHGRGGPGHLYGSGRCPGPEAGECPWLPTASCGPWARAATGRWAWRGTARTASR